MDNVYKMYGKVLTMKYVFGIMLIISIIIMVVIINKLQTEDGIAEMHDTVSKYLDEHTQEEYNEETKVEEVPQFYTIQPVKN